MLTLLQTALTLLLTGAAVALLVCSALPTPPGGGLLAVGFFFQVLLFVLLGPLLFFWARGPQPLEPAVTGAVVLVLLGSGTLYSRWLRKRQLSWLFGSAALWVTLGGSVGLPRPVREHLSEASEVGSAP